MVRFIKVGEDAEAAETTLVATMLNMEHGALAYDAKGEPLPAPHAPYPTVTIPAASRHGRAMRYHLRPTVGYVFYTANLAFRLDAFIQRVADALSARGHEHIAALRVADITPHASIKTRRHGEGGADGALLTEKACIPATVVTKSLAEYVQRDGEAPPLPARILASLPWLDGKLHSHISRCAGFTWIFASAAAIIESSTTVLEGAPTATGGRAPSSSVPATVYATQFNARTASILYDVASLATCADGADIDRVTMAHFTPIEPARPRLSLRASKKTAPPAAGEQKYVQPGWIPALP